MNDSVSRGSIAAMRPEINVPRVRHLLILPFLTTLPSPPVLFFFLFLIPFQPPPLTLHRLLKGGFPSQRQTLVFDVDDPPHDGRVDAFNE